MLHSIHRLSGIATPANVAYSAEELEHQLKTSGAKVLFTCAPVLKDALKAAKASGIPEDKVFILDIPGFQNPEGFKTVDELVEIGRRAPELEPLRWCKGQGARQVAFLCYSSGTSGLPVRWPWTLTIRARVLICASQKAVMISHRNVIANTMQYRLYESVGREKFGVDTQVALGLLPFSHIYGLVVISHGNTWRGDEVIVLPKFELTHYLQAIERFKINHLIVVPPIVVRMLSFKAECKKYDLSSVRLLYTGAAPMGKETVEELLKWFPKWHICQGYGTLDLNSLSS